VFARLFNTIKENFVATNQLLSLVIADLFQISESMQTVFKELHGLPQFVHKNYEIISLNFV
jgi:hypothetical protein